MATLNLQQLQALIAAGKRDEARQLLKSVLAAELSAADRGAAYVALAQLYLRLESGLNAAHLDTVRELLPKLDDVQRLQTKLDDQRSLAQARKQLAE